MNDDLEKVCALCFRQGFSTGHANTMDDLQLHKYYADKELKFRSDHVTAWRYAERAVLFLPRPHSGNEPPKDWKGYGMALKSTGIHVYKDNQSYLGFMWSGVTGYFLPEDLGWEE